MGCLQSQQDPDSDAHFKSSMTDPSSVININQSLFTKEDGIDYEKLDEAALLRGMSSEADEEKDFVHPNKRKDLVLKEHEIYTNHQTHYTPKRHPKRAPSSSQKLQGQSEASKAAARKLYSNSIPEPDYPDLKSSQSFTKPYKTMMTFFLIVAWIQMLH